MCYLGALTHVQPYEMCSLLRDCRI